MITLLVMNIVVSHTLDLDLTYLNVRMDINKCPDNKNAAGDLLFTFSPSGDFLNSVGDKFQFDHYESHAKNQIRYEKIGDYVTQHIYNMMEEKCHLERVPLRGSDHASPVESSSFVFATKNFATKPGKKLVLINGSGAVKAGQWARKIIINDNLYAGSMLPYIDWAAKNDFDVLVLNTNESGPHLIGSENPFNHAKTAWDIFLSNAEHDSVYIVAHSFGGEVTKSLALKQENFHDVVSKIAFTDSVHIGSLRCEDIPIINWVTSDEPPNDYLGKSNGCELRSAGTQEHPWTSHFAMDYIFEWFLQANS